MRQVAEKALTNFDRPRTHSKVPSQINGQTDDRTAAENNETAEVETGLVEQSGRVEAEMTCQETCIGSPSKNRNVQLSFTSIFVSNPTLKFLIFQLEQPIQ